MLCYGGKRKYWCWLFFSSTEERGTEVQYGWVSKSFNFPIVFSVLFLFFPPAASEGDGGHSSSSNSSRSGAPPPPAFILRPQSLPLSRYRRRHPAASALTNWRQRISDDTRFRIPYLLTSSWSNTSYLRPTTLSHHKHLVRPRIIVVYTRERGGGGKRTHVNFPLPPSTHERDDNKGRRTREALFLPSELNRH